MEIKAILFDKDGTLVGFQETFAPATEIVLRKICNNDEDLYRAAAEIVGFDVEKVRILPGSIIIHGSYKDIAGILSRVVDITNTTKFGARLDRMYGRICVDTVVAIPGAIAALEQFAALGLRLAIGTNDSEPNAVAQLQVLKIHHMFDMILGTDSGYGAKPEPGMIEAFIENSGFAPQEVIVVGDSLHDMEAGRRAGTRTVGVETGPASRADLEPGCDMVLASVVELVAFVSGSKAVQ